MKSQLYMAQVGTFFSQSDVNNFDFSESPAYLMELIFSTGSISMKFADSLISGL